MSGRGQKRDTVFMLAVHALSGTANRPVSSLTVRDLVVWPVSRVGVLRDALSSHQSIDDVDLPQKPAGLEGSAGFHTV